MLADGDEEAAADAPPSCAVVAHCGTNGGMESGMEAVGWQYSVIEEELGSSGNERFVALLARSGEHGGAD